MKVKAGAPRAAAGVARVAAKKPAPRALELVPAILVKTREELVQRLALAATVAKRAQLDVMDGRFVPNTTVQPHDLVGLKPPLDLEVHLMVEDPLAAMNAIGKRAELFLVHVETVGQGTAVDGKANVAELRARATELGARFGLAINAKTPVSAVLPHLDVVDEVLVMTVEAGFGGQPLIPQTLDKVAALRKLRPALDIEVDGGIDERTVGDAAKAGANVVVAGSALFGKSDLASAAATLIGSAARARDGA
ncbi:MAG: ribulose-phosphate 3-epimerase [Deltaproteobacteria bacterium]|nr:ribulose-phosphate 3-epimerase [Deltaproteobacteria bacterium]